MSKTNENTERIIRGVEANAADCAELKKQVAALTAMVASLTEKLNTHDEKITAQIAEIMQLLNKVSTPSSRNNKKTPPTKAAAGSEPKMPPNPYEWLKKRCCADNEWDAVLSEYFDGRTKADVVAEGRKLCESRGRGNTIPTTDPGLSFVCMYEVIKDSNALLNRVQEGYKAAVAAASAAGK